MRKNVNIELSNDRCQAMKDQKTTDRYISDGWYPSNQNYSLAKQQKKIVLLYKILLHVRFSTKPINEFFCIPSDSDAFLALDCFSYLVLGRQLKTNTIIL